MDEYNKIDDPWKHGQSKRWKRSGKTIIEHYHTTRHPPYLIMGTLVNFKYHM